MKPRREHRALVADLLRTVLDLDVATRPDCSPERREYLLTRVAQTLRETLAAVDKLRRRPGL